MDLEEPNVQCLKGKACLDNCVTVVDAAELFSNLASISSLKASTPVQTAAAKLRSKVNSELYAGEGGRSGNGG